jgi:hypothetical protein
MIAACGSLVLLVAAISHSPGQEDTEGQQQFILTTADLKQDYEVIGVLTHYQELEFGWSGDPLEGAIREGSEKFQEKALEAGATAVIGVRFEFENRNDKDEGRLLIYGTGVRLR